MTAVAVVGLGTMGSRIAARLLAAGTLPAVSSWTTGSKTFSAQATTRPGLRHQRGGR
jgi:3-hydroxyisobutyrate dehydrogenase-like beta-hydroxyacid dehydrogenase